MSDGRRTPLTAELQAEAYASDLLLPGYIFRPLARDIDRLTLASVKSLVVLFKTSLAATTIRALSTNRFPPLLICHSREGICWFRRPPIIPERWFPRPDLLPESPTFRMLFNGGPETSRPTMVKASCWFDTAIAERFTVT